MAANKAKKENNLKKASKPNWRHYNFTTAGPVDDYLYSMLPKRGDVLVEMEDYASKHDIPIVGPAVARVLQQLALMINAKTVFELGSAIGYSTVWWAQAVGEKGRVIYTDGDAGNAQRARGYFDRAGISNQINFTPAMRWNFSPSRSSSLISFSTMSTRKIIRAYCVWYRRVCARADCLLRIMFCGADAWQRKIRNVDNQGDSGVQSPTLQLGGFLYHDLAYP